MIKVEEIKSYYNKTIKNVLLKNEKGYLSFLEYCSKIDRKETNNQVLIFLQIYNKERTIDSNKKIYVMENNKVVDKSVSEVIYKKNNYNTNKIIENIKEKYKIKYNENDKVIKALSIKLCNHFKLSKDEKEQNFIAKSVSQILLDKLKIPSNITFGDIKEYKENPVQFVNILRNITTISNMLSEEINILENSTIKAPTVIVNEEKAIENQIKEEQISSDKNNYFNTSDNIKEEVVEEFRYDNNNEVSYGNQKSKLKDNIVAIKLLKELEQSQKKANKVQQEVLSQYTGFGGLPFAFDEKQTQWKEEYTTLKEILSDEEYTSVRASTLSAFYTEPYIIECMYRAIKNMDFKGGNILEPSCGIGNFLSAMPKEMYNNSKICSVELDSVSGRIAKYLHPNAKIEVTGFEKTEYKDNSFDVIIGNVPFGEFSVTDRTLDLPKNFLIHDYFFAKSLEKVKPNGIIAFITSSGTLDKKDSTVREYINKKAEFLGAVRLPNTAFKSIGNTEVVSDIIFLQKREQELENTTNPTFLSQGTTSDGLTINNYFIENSNMIIGELKKTTGQYGREIANVINKGTTQDIKMSIELALENIKVVNDINVRKTDLVIVQKTENPPNEYPNNSFIVKNDILYYHKDNDEILPTDYLNSTKINRGKLLCEIRDSYKRLIDIQQNVFTDEVFNSELNVLNKSYDEFNRKFGYIDNNANNFFRDDNSYFLLRSLEDEYSYTKEEKLNATKILPKKYTKSKAFFEPTIRQKENLNIGNAQMALSASLYKKGDVDLEYMSEIYSKSAEDIINELGYKVFLNPLTNKYETADEYLSGNVKEKLNYALSIKSDLSNDINETEIEKCILGLKKNLPTELNISEISFDLKSMWLPIEYKNEFILELLNITEHQKDFFKIIYNEHTVDYKILNKNILNYNLKNTNEYGTKRKSALQIIEDTLNLQMTTVIDYYEDEEGKKKSKYNDSETRLARNKQEIIEHKFLDFITSDINKINNIEKIYNERFNNIVNRKYDGTDIIIDNMARDIELRSHQKESISRIVLGGNTLLAHEVGAGKTYTMTAAAMVLKQAGISNKNMFVVPSHLTEQWGKDFLKLFPTANILVSTKKDFTKENRQIFINKIASGSYDAVILSFTQFEKIPMSPGFMRKEIDNQLSELRYSLSELDNQDDRLTIKQLEKQKKKLEERLEKLFITENKDNTLFFEQLGVDTLFVDEAHNYKNCFVTTKLQNISGIGKTSANKSEDLLMKTRYFHEKNNNNGGVVFATGTPITNSISEMFVMQRYLQPKILYDNGLSHFDAWVSSFGKIIEDSQLAPEGRSFRPKKRFEKFVNLPELINMFTSVADIKLIEDLDIQRPNIATGKTQTILVEPSPIVEQYVDYLVDRSEKIRNGSVDPKEDNMLKITLEAKKIALDPRLINPSFNINRDSKIYDCCDNVVKIYNDTIKEHSLQLIFIDFGVDTYKLIKNDLINQGVDEKEIALIHDYNTDKQKDDLFKKCRSGEIRVLLGSTPKLGAGTNIQDRMVALHHLDAPWRPADITQRDGRIRRQGNMYSEVNIFQYVTKGTFDSYLFQILEQKQKHISQIITNKSPARSCEDIDETTLSYAETKALACGDGTLKERMELENDIKKLQVEQSAHYSSKLLYKKIIDDFKGKSDNIKSNISKISNDIEYAKSINKEDFKIDIDGKIYNNRNTAGEVLLDNIKNITLSQNTKIANYNGFDIIINKTYHTELSIKRSGCVTFIAGDKPLGFVTKITNVIDRYPKLLAEYEENMNVLNDEYITAKTNINKPFDKADLIISKKERLNQLIIISEDKEKQRQERIHNKINTTDFNFIDVDFSDVIDVEDKNFDEELEMEI